MPLFVDHVGINTLINDDIDLDTNTRRLNERIHDYGRFSFHVPSTSSPTVCLTNPSITGYSSIMVKGISFWLNLDEIPTETSYILRLYNGSNLNSVTLFFNSSSELRVIFYDPSGNSVTGTWSSSQLNYSRLVGRWNHFAIGWGGRFGSPSSLRLTLNGRFEEEFPTITTNGTPSGTVLRDATVIALFDYPSSNSQYELKGRVSNFMITKSQMTGERARQAYFILGGQPIDATKYYEFDDPADVLDRWSLGDEQNIRNIPINGTMPAGTTIESIGANQNSLELQDDLIRRTGPVGPNGIKNPNFPGELRPEDELVALNTHRNGPYGYSSWKQLRVSENPITRYHKANSTMTFVVQPGPVRNILSNGELRVRNRYSALYSYTEPAIAQKAYPLVWNVGRHFKDEYGNVDLENPERFSIISSYANQGIGFANNQVDKLHKFDPDEEKTEYREIYKLYAEGGLNDQKSPLTHWEFLQYRETVFPHMKNQFQNENLERPNFTSFYRTRRQDRTRNYNWYEGHIFGYVYTDSEIYDSYGDDPAELFPVFASSWHLDEDEQFLNREYQSLTASIVFWYSGSADRDGDGILEFDIPSGNRSAAGRHRNGEGELMSTMRQFMDHEGETLNLNVAINNSTLYSTIEFYNERMAPGPLYMRRISLFNTASVSNPSGMVIPQTGGLTTGNKLFQGGALWEAGPTRQVKDADGNYVSAPKTPFYDTYENYIEEARRRYKNFSVVPEFRMSTQVEDYLTNNNAIELDMFDVTGGAENAQNSSQSQFYEIYSNSDFMRQFELINEDHKEFTNGKVLSLRCKAVKKFLPYEGFYPAQRTVDLAKRFYDSFKNNISLYNTNGVQLNNFNFGRQMVMTPLFAPGVLFNTIKSGIAVDYPIITGSLEPEAQTYAGTSEFVIYKNYFDKRIPFEALIEPHNHLAGFSLVSNEPHPSGNLSASATWDGQGDELYSKMANNFLAEVPEFFLPNGQLTSVVSKKQKDITLESGKVYGMRVKIRRSLNGTKGVVYHSGSEEQQYFPPQDILDGGVRENFTMYSRPSAFGPPSSGYNSPGAGVMSGSDTEFFDFGDRGIVGNFTSYAWKFIDSVAGYNFPFTAPYYHGEAWCEIVLTASSDKMTISEIQSSASYTYTRFDSSFYRAFSGSVNISLADQGIGNGPQSFTKTDATGRNLDKLNFNAVQLSASLNLQGIGKVGKSGGGLGGASGNLVVDSAVDEDSRWIIQTKFETPMFNFNHISEDNGTLSVPVYGSESVPRGMWHQYGRIPEENEGVFLEVGPIEENWWRKARGETGELKDLSAALGFSGQSTKIGRLRSSKKIYEAVVAVPFIESEGHKKFFRLNAAEVEAYKKGGEDRVALTSGDPQTQVGRSVLNQMQKMEKYIFPPSFDFLNYEEVDPIAMYIFEFSHTLSQQDLADIWQNLPPDIGTEMEESEVAITHPLLKKELLGEGGLQSGNTLIDMPNKLKWMVFKVKQRAASNYFKKTVLRNPEVNIDVDSGNVTVDEFGATSAIQYNWPYDFFSLVELVKLDAEVEFGNFRDEDIANYTDSIPPYEAQTADMDKIEFIVGGMGDDIVADVQAPEEPNEEPEDTPAETDWSQTIYGSQTLETILWLFTRNVETDTIFDSKREAANHWLKNTFTDSVAPLRDLWRSSGGQGEWIRGAIYSYINSLPGGIGSVAQTGLISMGAASMDMVSNEVRFSGNLPENIASAMVTQQSEDQKRATYLQDAKNWVTSFNNAKSQGATPTNIANGIASRSSFDSNPTFAIEFNLTDNLGNAIRTGEDIKSELMRFFRITG